MLPFSNYKFYAPQNTHPRVRETWTHARIVRGRKGSIDNKFTPIVKKKKERDNFFLEEGKQFSSILLECESVHYIRPSTGLLLRFVPAPVNQRLLRNVGTREKHRRVGRITRGRRGEVERHELIKIYRNEISKTSSQHLGRSRHYWPD